tara:strand:- start:349 stop:864 length:516 start_codon:yes stop_codon:yes gene_type:complete
MKLRVSLASFITIFSFAGFFSVAQASSCGGGDHSHSVVHTAKDNGNFTTLVAAVEAAGLTNTLDGQGPFTVFAPTDEAFAKLPSGTVENLLLSENLAALKEILTYHVLTANVMANDISDGVTEVKTVSGMPVRIVKKDGKVMINNAEVIATDIKADNGIIHVIDEVLIPNS